MRLGILTNGGDCPGLNRGIMDALRHVQSSGAEAVLLSRGFESLVNVGYGAPPASVIVPHELIDRRQVIRSGGTFLQSSRLYVPDHISAAVAGAAILGIDGLIVFGGDGSLRGGSHLSDAGLVVAGVPKTIDNDIAETERSVGFLTAVDTGLDAVERIYDTARSHRTAFLVETMGRRSGILAAAIALAADADGVCLPEHPIAVSTLTERLRPGSIVVVAEGAWCDALGERTRDAHGRPVIGGIGDALATHIAPQTTVALRSVSLGHILRGGPPNAADRATASALGILAANLALAGSSGLAVVRDGRYTTVDLTSTRRFLDGDDLAVLRNLIA